MIVKKTLLIGLMALLASVFAAPSGAQADVYISENGVALEEGARVTATSTNVRTTIGANTIECKKITFHYEVVTNGPTHIVLDPVVSAGKHNGAAENCVTKTPIGSFTNHVTNIGTGSVTINIWGHGSTSYTFTSLTTFINRHCSYSGTLTIDGLTSGGSDLELPGSTLKGTEENCGEMTVHGTFGLETPNGAPVSISFTKTS